jgi:2,4-dienoyl-CoA reductase-like NADH-dependent reductase (Old Yellow Enzyme family)
VQRTLNLACAVADALKPAPFDAKQPRAAKELSVDAMIDEECERIINDFAKATRACAKAQAEGKTR